MVIDWSARIQVMELHGPTIVERTVCRMPRRRRLSARIGMLLGVVFGVVQVMLYLGGDQSAAPTMFLFGPRWIVVAPWAVLVLLAILARSWLLTAVTVLLGLGVLGPLTGGNVPVDRLFDSNRPALQKVRVVTWNMGGKERGPGFRQ